jgi:hypothetical protein
MVANKAMLEEVNADISDALDALGKGDVSKAIGVLKACAMAVRSEIDAIENPSDA